MNTPNNRTRLTTVQTAKLYNWLDTNKTKAQSETADELAKQSSIALAFSVCSSNIDNLRRQMGLSPRQRIQADATKQSDRIALLAREIIRISKGLNTPLTEPFTREFHAFL